MLLYMEIPLILFFLGLFFRVYSLVLYKKNNENLDIMLKWIWFWTSKPL